MDDVEQYVSAVQGDDTLLDLIRSYVFSLADGCPLRCEVEISYQLRSGYSVTRKWRSSGRLRCEDLEGPNLIWGSNKLLKENCYAGQSWCQEMLFVRRQWRPCGFEGSKDC